MSATRRTPGRRYPGQPPASPNESAGKIADVGRTLYGERFVSGLARDLNEHERQVRRWLRGEHDVPPIALHRARLLVEEQQARLLRLATRLGLDVDTTI